ncbi:MAG: hypothetical protein V1867_00805 [Candidatus Falkowbacteria bacterium]
MDKESITTQPEESRSDIISAITSPLGFFVLALLIVEAFIAIVLVFSDLALDKKYYGMCLGVGIFVLLIIIVFLLVWFKPRHLMFGEKSHLDALKHQNSWGTSDDPETKSKAEDSKLSTPDASNT